MVTNILKRHLMLIFIAVVAILGVSRPAMSQQNTLALSKAFEQDEYIKYKLVFEWGIIRGKVGEATLSNKKINSGQQYFSQLIFKTTGVGDAFYSLRDTFETLYSNYNKPLRFEKRVTDKGVLYVDEVSFNHSPSVVRASVKSYADRNINVDTVYTYNPKEIEVIDVLSSLAYVRGLDISNPSGINGRKVMIPIGRSQAVTDIKYMGMEKVKGVNGKKVDAVIISLNIKDEAFQSQKNSVTVWVSNDELRVPLKVTANLKVGKVVVEVASYRN